MTTLPDFGPHLGTCVWSLAMEPGRIRAGNRALATLLGFSEAELGTRIERGLYWQDIVGQSGLAAHCDRVAEITDHGSAAPAEVAVALPAGGQTVWLVTAWRAAADSDDVLSTCIDVTGFSSMRAESERANAAKSRFLAAVSHELRTPLNTISGQTSLIAEGVHGAVSDKQRDALGRVTRAERQLRQVIDSVLTFSRIELGDMNYTIEPVFVAPVVQEVIASLDSQAAARTLSVDTSELTGTDVVLADREKLAQIIATLVSNAIKFTAPGGRISVGVARRREVPEFVFIRVADTGTGIPQDRFDHIFEPFAQQSSGIARAADGLGLGLTICRDLARAMGGEVRVRSREGEGSVFTVALRSP